MKKVTFFTVCVLAMFVNEYKVEAKVFTKCGLTKELLNNGFDRTYVGNWVCLIESESAKNSSRVTQKANGSKSYGLFQINDKLWCKSGTKGGKCNAKCEEKNDAYNMRPLLGQDIIQIEVQGKRGPGRSGVTNLGLPTEF